MPFTGSAPNQAYGRTDGVRSGAAVCVQARGSGANDTAELSDARENDLATAINSLWKRDGGNQPSANLPMNGFKFTGAGVASARDEFPRASQVQDSSLIYGGTAGGTADAITLDLTPSITAYVAGQMFLFKAAADNTSVDVTINVDGVGNLNVRKFDGATKPAVGEIQNGGMHLVMYDGTSLNLYGSISPNETAFAALTGASGKVPMFTAAGALSLVDRTDLGVPSGTRMLFQQTSAPTGWTKDTNPGLNHALRCTGGAVGTGGATGFTSVFGSKTVAGTIGGTAISIAQMPLHGHGVNYSLNSGNDSDTTGGVMLSNNDQSTFAAHTGAPSSTAGQAIGGTGGGATHDHSFTGTAIDMNVLYVDVMIAAKN